MNRKIIIYCVVGLIITVFLLYHSVYFTSLEEHRKELAGATFDPVKAITQFWEEGPEKLAVEALSLNEFDKLLAENPQKMVPEFGKTLGIGAPYSFLIKGEVRIKEVKNDEIILYAPGEISYAIRTRFIFSNTVREASGYFDLDKFETTMEFNMVAMEINKHIEQQVIAPELSYLKPEAIVAFLGAADINLRHFPVTSVEIVPIRLNVFKP